MDKRIPLEVHIITDEVKKDKAVKLIKRGLKLLKKSIEVQIVDGSN